MSILKAKNDEFEIFYNLLFRECCRCIYNDIEDTSFTATDAHSDNKCFLTVEIAKCLGFFYL